MKKIYITWCLFVCIPLSVFSSGEPHICVNSSLALEALLSLNAFSKDTLFNRHYTTDQEYWHPRIHKEQDVFNAFTIWQGDGISLAYLFSSYPHEDIDDLVTFIDSLAEVPYKMENKSIAEGEYIAVWKKLVEHGDDLKSYLLFLKQNDFRSYWNRYAPDIEAGINTIWKRIEPLNQEKFSSCLSKFDIETDTVNIYVTYFSGDYGYSLLNGQIGISVFNADAVPYLLPHELCHAYTMPESLKRYFQKLSQRSPYYQESYQRIYHTYREGKEEELVMAAGLYVSYCSGLLSKKQCLRWIKNSLVNLNDLSNIGAPIAGIIFHKLLENEGQFESYTDFVIKLKDQGYFSADSIETLFKKSISDIAGIAGMKLVDEGGQIVVESIFPGYAAYDSGIRSGDRIIAVDNISIRNLEEGLDLLSGSKGEQKKVELSRSEERFTKTLVLH